MPSKVHGEDYVVARCKNGVISFPAFVHYKDLQLLGPDSPLASRGAIKLVDLQLGLARPQDPRRCDSPRSFKSLLAAAFNIEPESRIYGILAPVSGKKILVQTDQEWQDWGDGYRCRDGLCLAGRQETPFEIKLNPIEIELLLKEESTTKSAGAPSLASSEDAPDPVDLPPLPREHHQGQQTQPFSAASETQSINHSIPQLTQSIAARIQQFTSAALSSNSSERADGQNRSAAPTDILTNLLNAIPNLPSELQPMVANAAQAVAPMAANVAMAATMIGHRARQAPSTAATGADRATTSHDTAGESLAPSQESTEPTSLPTADPASEERQSLFNGLADELARLREQRTASTTIGPSPPLQTATPDEGVHSSTPDRVQDVELKEELEEAFVEFLSADQNSASTEQESEVDEVVSVSSSSDISIAAEERKRRSRSRSRSPRGSARSTLFSSSITLLTLFAFVCSLLMPVASASAVALKTDVPDVVTGSLFARSQADVLVDIPMVARQSSRHLHLCKCTCFQTNSTLVPLYSPKDPAKPCSTCTRQFCLDQGLEICKDAKLEHTDHDVGTGFEGDVWAKCFERDSYKDQSIITLYLLVIIALVAFALMRKRMESWYQDYANLGPGGLYQAVRDAPWRRR